MAVILTLQQYLPSSLAAWSPLQYLVSSPEPGTVVAYEKGKLMRVAGSICVGLHGIWKLVRMISMSGNSKNPLIKYLHNLLRGYLNCGFMVRNEFYVQLPWQYLWIRRGSYVTVNFGSYGTVPRKVLQHQINLQIELEESPDNFNRITLLEKYEESRKIVAKFVRSKVENLVFVDNITDGINCTLRSVLKDLDEEDIVLHTNLTYAAVIKSIAIYTKSYNLKILQFDVQFPVVSEDDLCEAYEAMVKAHPKIKVAIFDHISSASAVCFPIKRFGKICREHNIMTIVDGAHAPGQVHLNLESYGVDIYLGNLHKWYYTPKSCAIMYINPKYHDKIHPSLVSHEYYLGVHERFRGQGTKNYSAHITAGYAVGEYMEKIGGIDHLHSYITPLVDWVVKLYTQEWSCEEVAIPDSMKAPYMRVVNLPEIFTKVYGFENDDSDRMIVDMIKNYNICMFVNQVNYRLCTRVSAQIFSTKREYLHVAKVIKNLALEIESKYKSNNKLRY